MMSKHKRPKPDYRVEMVSEWKPKPPTWFDIFYESMCQAAWFAAFVLLAMRVIGDL